MLEAVFLDWAGTTVDFGSRTPAKVFVEIFHRRGVDITIEESRAPMGLAKRDHIEAIVRTPRVAQCWHDVHGRPADDADVQRMYDEFLPLQKEALRGGSDMIPGVPDAIACCRSRGLKIGSSTGYTRALMEVVAPIAEQAGYKPDVIVCSDEVSQGRPSPLMNQRAAELLGVTDMASVLVVDDTAVGIEAGKRTGSPTVALTDSGNAMGLSYDQWVALSAEERLSRRGPIESMFREAGADFMLPTLADLPTLLADSFGE